jgi:hypothetical protein
MIKLFEKFNDDITYQDLQQVKNFVDKYFEKLGLDIKFSKHFLERINDPRNNPKITIEELNKIFKEVYDEHGTELKMKKDDYTAVIKDMTTDINTPFVMNYDWKTGDIDIILKTIMRKDNFKTSTDVYEIETEEEFPEIFNHTIYRLATDDELLDFKNYPKLTTQDIINGFSYTIVGRGIMDDQKKDMIYKSIERLIELFPENNIYKEALLKIKDSKKDKQALLKSEKLITKFKSFK